MHPRESIDVIMKLGANHPMGPLELADLIGLDVCLAILEVLHAELGEKYKPCPLLRKMVAGKSSDGKAGKDFMNIGNERIKIGKRKKTKV